jgi:glycosyltransferase involved in cell wall biosynthesis
MSEVAVYTITHNKLDLTKRSFRMLRRYAGMEFDHYVFDNGSTDGTPEYLDGNEHIYQKHLAKTNYGQNIAANILLDEMMGQGYKWILRWDNDAIPKTRRFLKKLVHVAEMIYEAGHGCITSPKILKLENPPPAVGRGDDVGQPYDVVQILGGICRLHPAEFFQDWRFNQFGAKGFGEAAEVADRCSQINWGMIRLRNVKVEHAHGDSGQRDLYPELFDFEREVNRLVGYGL